MSFFKKNDSANVNAAADGVPISSIIGKGLVFTGNLLFSGKMRLDGKVKGNIKGEHLILGESGSITGDVETDTCTCQGRVIGNIKSKDLTVTKGCRIDGNVETINLSVESGASLNGEIKVDTKDLRLVKGTTPKQIEGLPGEERQDRQPATAVLAK